MDNQNRPIKNYYKPRGIKLKDVAKKFGLSNSTFLSQIDSQKRPAPKWLSDALVLDSGGYIRADQIAGKKSKDILAPCLSKD